MKTKQLVIAMTLCGVSMTFSDTVIAQQDYPVVINRLPASEADMRMDDKIRIGKFVFEPTFGFTEYYDSNIFATADQETSDTVSEIKASVNLDSEWKAHDLGAEAGVNMARYAEYDTENSVDNWISFRGQYDASRNAQLFAGASLTNDHEDRSSPNEAYGTEPTQFSEQGLDAGYLQKFGQHSLTLAINSRQYDFDDVGTTTDIIDNDGRDYTQTSYGLRFNYAFAPRYFIFLQATNDDRDYDLATDTGGFNHDSSGQVYALGFKFMRKPQLQGELFIGQMTQHYDDIQFQTLDTSDFGANIRSLLGDTLTFNLVIDRTLEETTLSGASGFLYTQYALRADQRFGSQWLCNLNASRGDIEYQTLWRDDTYKDYGIGVSFSPEAGLAFTADYRAMQLSSNEPADAYRRNRILLSVSARM